MNDQAKLVYDAQDLERFLVCRERAGMSTEWSPFMNLTPLSTTAEHS
jgi:hypothetical protein